MATELVSTADLIRDVAKSLNEEFALEVAIPGWAENMSDVKRWVPTASPMLNLLLGNDNYGVACGRIIEIFGDFSHGKSTILQYIMNAFQAAGGLTTLIDAESGWNRKHAIAIGHNPDRHLAVEVDTVESGFRVLRSLCARYHAVFQGAVPVLFGWDTIAASPTEGERLDDEYAQGMMYKARKIRSELRSLAPSLAKAGFTLAVVNQTIEGKDQKPGQKTTAGGGGIKFWASQRLEVTKVASYSRYDDKQIGAGIITKCRLVKNKLDIPMRSVDVPINFTTGVDPRREVMNYLLDNSRIVNIAGAYKRIVGFGEKDLSFYEKDTDEVFAANPGLYEWLVSQAKYVWKSKESSSLIVDGQDLPK